MRWMSDAAGETLAVCLHCDRELPADPARTFYCYCRSSGALSPVVANDLASARPAEAA